MPPLKSRPLVSLLLASLFLATFGLYLWTGRKKEESEGIQLVLVRAAQGLNGGVEWRFSEPVVEETSIGLEGELFPLEITPPLSGRWNWNTTRSGRFVPETGIEPSTTYHF